MKPDGIVFDLEPDDEATEAARALMRAANVPSGREVEIVARDRSGGLVGTVIAHGDEWSIVVVAGRRSEGIATAMVRALIANGLTGFMVACSEDGAEFLFNLRHQLNEEELESLDVPSWEREDNFEFFQQGC